MEMTYARTIIFSEIALFFPGCQGASFYHISVALFFLVNPLSISFVISVYRTCFSQNFLYQLL